MFKVSSANRFESVVSFLSRKLKGMEGMDGTGAGVFCYVNSVFAPGLDEGVGGLWRVSFFSSFLWRCWGGGDEGEMKRERERGEEGGDSERWRRGAWEGTGAGYLDLG